MPSHNSSQGHECACAEAQSSKFTHLCAKASGELKVWATVLTLPLAPCSPLPRLPLSVNKAYGVAPAEPSTVDAQGATVTEALHSVKHAGKPEE